MNGWSGVLLVRPLPGVVGERDRMVHVVPIPVGETAPEWLAAYCGQRFGPGTIELLSELRGMPCVRCVAEGPGPSVEQLPDVGR